MELMTVGSDDLARLFCFQLNEYEIAEIIFLYGHYLHGELFFSLLPQTIIKLNNTTHSKHMLLLLFFRGLEKQCNKNEIIGLSCIG